ncbi:MAG: hypothetical protein Q9165_004461 [Trypethelium subeluteriae]
MPSGSESPGDDYFNDLSQQPEKTRPGRKNSGGLENDGEGENTNNGNANKQKRIACGTCKRLAHDCAYDEVRRKSGPKRGYVKALEARLAQVETLLKDQNTDGTNKDGPTANSLDINGSSMHQPSLNMAPDNGSLSMGQGNKHAMEAVSRLASTSSMPNPDAFAGTLGDMSIDQQGDDSFPWEMIGLGLEEPLPSQDIMNDL